MDRFFPINEKEAENTMGNGTDSSQSWELREMKEELAKNTNEIQDLRALLQSTSEANDAKLNSLQYQLDTIIRMVSGGPWMFNPLPQMFTQSPVLQNIPQENIVDQGAPPSSSEIPDTEWIDVSQPPPSIPQVKLTIVDVPQDPTPNEEEELHESPEIMEVYSRIIPKDTSVDRETPPSQTPRSKDSSVSQPTIIVTQVKSKTPDVTQKKPSPGKTSEVPKNRFCSFCDSRDHNNQECPEYFIGISVTERRDMLEKEDRCLYCFEWNCSGTHDKCQKNLCQTCIKKFKNPEKALHHKYLCLEEERTSKSPSPEPKRIRIQLRRNAKRHAPYPWQSRMLP